MGDKMIDAWYMFPATMGEDQAWIAFNNGYAEVAKADPRNYIFRVNTTFKDADENGMPTDEEFPNITALDEMLDNRITKVNGVYVGRVTVRGHRYFYYYLDIAEDALKPIIAQAEKETGYQIEYKYQEDVSKQFYWNELYPTNDDWRVINDMQVLDQLAEHGDNPEAKREIKHWAYFGAQSASVDFANWAKEEGYAVTYQGAVQEGEGYVVQFSHTGAAHLWDLSQYTIAINRKAEELEGNYDGWETSVEKD